ncbi:MAG: HdeD family acid-resistance protein [Silvibacterium sp.]
MTEALRKASGWAIAWAILIIIAGFIAITTPFISGIGITIVIGWLLVISGVFHVIESFHARGAGSFIWRLIVGLIYIIGGADIALHPAYGLITLTLFLGIILLIQGVLGVVAFFSHRNLPGSVWILINSLINLAFGAFIWWDGPRAAVWVIGTLVGVVLIFSGITRLMIWGAIHKSLRPSTV